MRKNNINFLSPFSYYYFYFFSVLKAHQLDQLNSQLNDLKKLRELLVVYLKLITIRAQHKQLDSNLNVNKLNDLLSQIDDRKLNYEKEKRKLKG